MKMIAVTRDTTVEDMACASFQRAFPDEPGERS
jgi:hypothetical protein